jgi:hypothetical protein
VGVAGRDPPSTRDAPPARARPRDRGSDDTQGEAAGFGETVVEREIGIRRGEEPGQRLQSSELVDFPGEGGVRPAEGLGLLEHEPTEPTTLRLKPCVRVTQIVEEGVRFLKQIRERMIPGRGEDTVALPRGHPPASPASGRSCTARCSR